MYGCEFEFWNLSLCCCCHWLAMLRFSETVWIGLLCPSDFLHCEKYSCSAFGSLLQFLTRFIDTIFLSSDVVFTNINGMHQRLYGIQVGADVGAEHRFWCGLPGDWFGGDVQCSGNRLQQRGIIHVRSNRLQRTRQFNGTEFRAVHVAGVESLWNEKNTQKC